MYIYGVIQETYHVNGDVVISTQSLIYIMM
jgi:hypothetical protein